MPDTVLILGARGRLGAAVVAAFAAAGWQVLAQARRAPTTQPHPRVRWIDAPLHDAEALSRQAGGASLVVHAVNPPYTQWQAQALPLLCQGLDVAERLGARFMLPGNVYNYGAGMPPRLLPQTPEHPTTRKGRIRFDMEAEMAARGRRGLRSLVLRAGDFFGGEGRGVWFDLVVARDVAKGKVCYPGPLDQAHAWAYLPDLAQAFVAVAARDWPLGLTRLNFAGHTLTGADLHAALERVAGRSLQHKGLPWGLMRLGGLLIPSWREIVEMEYLWRVPHHLDGADLQAFAGPVPATPLDTALRHSLAALGQLGAGAKHAISGAA